MFASEIKSLLEDPLLTLETLKPWIFSGHIKDMGVQPYAEGFLLSEVPFGEGFLDLKKMVEANREMGKALRGSDFREGVASFMEKRPPKFTGR